jgi:hypothetical protein
MCNSARSLLCTLLVHPRVLDSLLRTESRSVRLYELHPLLFLPAVSGTNMAGPVHDELGVSDCGVEFPPIIAPVESERYGELVVRRQLLKTFADDLGVGSFWEQDAFPGPLPDQVERRHWARTRSLAYSVLDDCSIVRMHVLALLLDAPSALDLFEAAVNGGWGLHLSYDESELWRFRETAAPPNETPVWVREPAKPQGYLYRNRVGNFGALCAQYLTNVRELIAQRPHLNQSVLDGGNIVGAVYRQYASLEDLRRLQDGPSSFTLYFGGWCRDPSGHVYERVREVERRMLLGLVLEDGNPDYERWMYPPEDAFLSSGRWALRAYHASDLAFVRRRAAEIASGAAVPKTRSQWIEALRMGSRRRQDCRLVPTIRSTMDSALGNLYRTTKWSFVRGLWDLEQFGEQLTDTQEDFELCNEHLTANEVGGYVTGRDATVTYSSVTL